MPDTASSPLPDVARILGPLLQSVPAEQRALLLVLAERLAAQRYRAGAADVADPRAAAELPACAPLEEHDSSNLEALLVRGSRPVRS